ncbi:hypothetical protein ACHAXR_004835 [Thalassiosira sp. AJA248-18]
MPFDTADTVYHSCCGKSICNGCTFQFFHEIARTGPKESICPFCRAPSAASDKESFKRINKRIEAGDAGAMHTLGDQYSRGEGVAQDSNKALELWHQAANLGCAKSHTQIASTFTEGLVVGTDYKKAGYHWEIAAMKGCMVARHNLGMIEKEIDMNRAMRHFMIAAESGYVESMNQIVIGYKNGHITKDEVEKALRANHVSKKDMMSDERSFVAQQYT